MTAALELKNRKNLDHKYVTVQPLIPGHSTAVALLDNLT